LLFGTSARFSDIVLTVSSYSQKQIAKHFKVANIGITPNGIDPEYFHDYNQAEVRQHVKSKHGLSNYWLYVSRREPRKNHLSLLRAFVEDRHFVEYQLVFVGIDALADVAYNNYWNKLEKSIQQRVISLQQVSSDDLPNIVRASSLSVYPSFAEGFGIPPLESLAAGVPTICSNATAMADFTIFGDLAFDPHDLNALKSAIKRALANPNVGDKRQKVRDQYSWMVAAKSLLDKLTCG
jgi:glycosyltransferase involved in cell wall biosynthesis